MISRRKDSSQASGCVAVIRPGSRSIEEPPHSKKMAPDDDGELDELIAGMNAAQNVRPRGT